jgi:hypothetical protein
MLTGWKEVAPDQGPPATGGGPLAFIVALAFAVAAVYAGSGAWLPPPAAEPVSAPAW